MTWRDVMEWLARTNPRLVLKLIELERRDATLESRRRRELPEAAPGFGRGNILAEAS